MRYWHTTACALLLGGLLTPSLSADGFEPFGVRSIARHLGVGCGNGYHARPCHPQHRAFYDCVTQGGTPLGITDTRRVHGGVGNAGTYTFFPPSDGRIPGPAGLDSHTPAPSAGAINGNAGEVEDEDLEYLPNDVLPSQPIPSEGENVEPEPTGEEAAPQLETPEASPSPSDNANTTSGYQFSQFSGHPPAGTFGRPLSPNKAWSQQPPAANSHQSPTFYRGRDIPQPTPSPRPRRGVDWRMNNYLWH